MAQLEDLSSTELLNFIIYDTISASATQNPKLFTNYSTISSSTSLESHSSLDNASTAFMLDHCHSIMKPPRQAEDAGCRFINLGACSSTTSPMMTMNSCGMRRQSNVGVVKAEGGGRKKSRRKRARVCKNREEAETQRMTHITVERNRRKQMNEYLAVLRSLMPDSYVQRGDQASIVEGAIEFVKELEHHLQSLEAQKLQQQGNGDQEDMASSKGKMLEAPFAQFFMYPQYSWSQTPNKYTSKSKGAIADIEVSLIETHANLRILLRRCVMQLSKLVAAFHALHLPILHLTRTTMDQLALYSISAKVEEGSQLSSVDDIAAAVHHMLMVIEAEEATALS